MFTLRLAYFRRKARRSLRFHLPAEYGTIWWNQSRWL